MAERELWKYPFGEEGVEALPHGGRALLEIVGYFDGTVSRGLEFMRDNKSGDEWLRSWERESLGVQSVPVPALAGKGILWLKWTYFIAALPLMVFW